MDNKQYGCNYTVLSVVPKEIFQFVRSQKTLFDWKPIENSSIEYLRGRCGKHYIENFLQN